jgi:hypothetical protein
MALMTCNACVCHAEQDIDMGGCVLQLAASGPPWRARAAIRPHLRCALFNSQYQIVQVVSQTDIMRYLHEHKDTIRDAMKTKLMDVPGAHSMALALSQFVCTSCRYHGEEH